MKIMETYNGISLSSGAARGYYQLGALHAAESNGKLKEVKYYAGSSVGGAISLLLAVGWTSLEIFTHLCTHDISSCVAYTFDLEQTLTKWGMMNTDALKHYVKRMIIAKWGGIPTFSDLHKEGKYFVCCAYRLKSKDPCVYFSPTTHPQMSTLDAILLSMSIPLIFECSSFEGSFYIDGGLFDKNPAKYLEAVIRGEATTPQILSVSLETREHEVEEESITEFSEYIKEVLLVSVYQQKKVETTNSIHSLYLTIKETNDEVSLVIPSKDKIEWFCSGLQQGLNYFANTLEATESSESTLSNMNDSLDNTGSLINSPFDTNAS
jgi:predicted acylesterase/phospholipase RssA